MQLTAVFVVLCANGVPSEKMHVLANQKPASNTGEMTQWFRFHPDGSVFATGTDPAADRVRIFDQLREGSSIHKYFGRYQLSGSNIEFVLNNDGYRDSTYHGSASPTRLRLTERTSSGAEFTNDYGFVRVNR